MSVAAVANIRWEVDSELTSTDATQFAGGSTRMSVCPELAQSLYRLTERAGADVHLLTEEERASPNDSRPEDCEVLPPSEEVSELSLRLGWGRPRSYRFSKKAHINLQEMRALQMEIKRWARTGTVNRRSIVFVDCRVVVGAYGKGKSSSLRLNSILRTSMADSILGRQKIEVLY